MSKENSGFKRTAYIPVILSALVCLFLLWLGLKLYVKPKPAALSAVVSTPNQIISNDGVATLPVSNTPVVESTIVIGGPVLPQPKTSESLGNAKYAGDLIGKMHLSTGKNYEVFTPVYAMDGGLVIPDSGLVFWKGYFIGHLIQRNGWLIVDPSVRITWDEIGENEVVYQADSGIDIPGFSGTFTELADGQIKLVTCYVDVNKSTVAHRIFGGNKIYTLTPQ